MTDPHSPRSFLPKRLDLSVRDLRHVVEQIRFVPAQKNFRVFGVGDDVEQMLRQDVERGWIVKGEDQNRRLRELVVAGGDGGDALHPPGVPQLQLKSQRYADVRGVGGVPLGLCR